MTLEEIKSDIEYYEEFVMQKPISKDMGGHTIEGFAISPTSPDQYQFFLLGQDLTHAVPIVKKPLEERLIENGY